MHAWLTRGLVTAADIGRWRYDGDESQVADLMKQTPNAMNHLLALESLPEVGDDDKNKELLKLAEQGPLPGESCSHWCVLTLDSSSSDAKPTPLPDWMKIPLDRTIAIWNRERQDWDNKKALRLKTKGTAELSKGAEEKYQDGKSCSDTWVLHICMHTYVYIYICIYIYRERDVCVCVYIYTRCLLVFKNVS